MIFQKKYFAILTTFLAGCAYIAYSQTSVKAPNIQITVPSNNKYKTDKLTIEQRLESLEKEVNQLQNKVAYLSHKDNRGSTVVIQHTDHKEKTWSCFLTDSFGETFTADGKNKEQARGKTLQKCGRATFCKANKVKCSAS